MSCKVHYTEFDAANLIFGKTEEQTTKANGQDIKYYRIPVQYMYTVTSPDGRKSQVKDSLYIEGPKMRSRGPSMKSYDDNKGKEQWTLFTKYDLTNPEHSSFVDRASDRTPGTMHKLVTGCCKEVFDRAKSVGLGNLRNTEAVLDAAYYPVLWQMDRGEPISGENPASIWKLMRYAYGKDKKNIRETSFILPVNGGQNVSWDMLADTNIVHQPLIKIDNITIASSRPSIKMEVVSSVIYDILSSSADNRQLDTVKEASKNDVATAMLLEKVKELESKLNQVTVSEKKVEPTSYMDIPGLPAPASVQKAPVNTPSLSSILSAAPVEPVVAPLPVIAPPLPVLTLPVPPALPIAPLL